MFSGIYIIENSENLPVLGVGRKSEAYYINIKNQNWNI